MGRVIKYLILVLVLVSCSSTREASYESRKGLMLLKPEEYNGNKPYKQSKQKLKVHKKAKKSLLKSSYKNK
jgi:hypothetical protein